MYAAENPLHEIEHDDPSVQLNDQIQGIHGLEAQQSSLQSDRLRYHHQDSHTLWAYDTPDSFVIQTSGQIHPENYY